MLVPTVLTTWASQFPLRKPQVLTNNSEEWTIAFNTYMIIVVQKFPNHAPELLQYIEIIRHAANAHGGWLRLVYI